jgi:GWxTD domain-containing protein
MAVIPIRTIDLRQGSYELRITADTASLRTRFRTRWLDMPRMLRDLDLALLPLQYIMTEDQYAAMNDGGRRERIEKFDAFWRKKDPTPGTAYNEMLAEFYKRADHAMSAYRTLKEFNGAMTDRGRIFILYGKPTSTERSLRPGDVPKEIWVYATLKKTFVFEDPSRQGNYKLAESR